MTKSSGKAGTRRRVTNGPATTEPSRSRRRTAAPLPTGIDDTVLEPVESEPDFVSDAQSMEGVVDDWASVDDTDDRVVDEPAITRRRR